MGADRPTYEVLEQRLGKLEAALQDCERLSAANRYAAAVVHEVNNPLEAVTNLIYLIGQEAQTEPARGYLALLEEQLALLTAVTRPSLAFHREQKASAPVDLALLVESAGKLHAARLDAAGIVLHRRSPDRALCEAVGGELLQVLSNLILNAAEALSASGRGAHIHIRVRRCRDCVHLFVIDDGPGIPEHLEGKLFQAHATGKPRGSGLGLWLSERIILNHRGTIRCRTCRKPGRSGTAFRIYLPCGAAA